MKMTSKLAVVFGGSGFIGRYVVSRLAARGYQVRVAVRDVRSAAALQPMGLTGQIIPLYAPTSEEALVARAAEGADLVVNLTGVLSERRQGDFFRIHADGAGRIARLAASSVATRFVHISAIGAEAGSNSAYARSKAAGEAAVRAAFSKATIIRPSIVFGAEDAFFNRFAAMAALSPVLPIVHGDTRFQPVFVGDLADAVAAALVDEEAPGKTYEIAGPEIRTFRQLIEYMLKTIERRRMVWDLPLGLARLQAAVLQHLPGQLLTVDQVELLSKDNVAAPNSLGLIALDVTPTPMDLVVPGYLSRFRPGGRRRESAFDTKHD